MFLILPCLNMQQCSNLTYYSLPSEIFFRRSWKRWILTYIFVEWRLSGISAIRRFIGWFRKHWKWRVGNQEKIPFSIGWTWYARKVKATLLKCKCFTKFCFVRRLFFGVLLSGVFLYQNNIQLRVKQNILWISNK